MKQHMKTLMGFCGAMAFAGLVVSAQATNPQTTQQPEPEKKVTGCLKKWDAATMGGTGTGRITNTTGAEYVLTDIDSTPAAGAGTATGSVATQAQHPDRYLVKAKDATVTLSTHVDHKVELTGTVDPAGAATTAQTSDVPTLTVTAVRMVAASCS